MYVNSIFFFIINQHCNSRCILLMLIPIEMSRSNFQALWLVTEGGSTWVSLLNNSGRFVTLL